MLFWNFTNVKPFYNGKADLNVLFQILAEVSQSHVATAQERVVEGQCCPHRLWLMAHRSYVFHVVAQQWTIVRMGTILDDLFGSPHRTLTAQVGNALFGDDDIDVVLGGIHMAAHRNDGRNGTILGC